MPFSSQYSKDGALIFNVDYQSVLSIKSQLEKKYNLKLAGRKEAHITIITPPEAQGWFTDKLGINYLISTKEIINKYSKTLQDLKFEVKCVGMLKEKTKQVFYLVVSSNEILKVREELLQELKIRAKFTQHKIYFDPENYYPHITIGFVKGDIHGKSKGLETCVEEIEVVR